MRGNCTFQMAFNSCKIDDIEKMVGGTEKYMYCKKTNFGAFNEIPSPGGRELICHAMSLHPLSIVNISRQKYVKNINMKRDIGLSSCRCV